MEQSDKKPQIFISYSHEDKKLFEEFKTMLAPAIQKGIVDLWDDTRIAAGARWRDEIASALASAKVAVLLVSQHFLASDFIAKQELPPLLKAAEEKGVTVFWIYFSACLYEQTEIAEYQAAHDVSRPLDQLSKPKRQAVFSEVCSKLIRLAKNLDGRSHSSGASPVGQKSDATIIDLSKLPAGAADFLGREDELKLLDEAWADSRRTQIVELVAPGGVGKTALVKRWLDRLKADGWRGAQRVYGWSFFSQGTSDDRQASDDSFLNAALNWFGVDFDPALSPWDKGKRLADAVAGSRSLLVLDGVEPLQYPPGPQGGELRAPGLKAMLNQLASGGQPGLCVITTRERIKDLAEYERGEDYPEGALVRIDLGNLSDADGARLLHKLGVRRAGAAVINSDDAELKQASREVHGHALTLSLLGGYLAQAHEGDIRQRDKVEFDRADEETRGGQAFKVMAAYERWFQREGEKGKRELAALRLLGFFDRPADQACLAALRQAPPIPGLTEPLVDLSAAQWNVTLSRLTECGLIEQPQPGSSAIDAHPLVREYLAKALRECQPDAWREGHRRIYEHLKASTPHRPDGLAGLQPLYQAVAHGCLAGLHREARAEVYRDRIQRGTGYDGFYSSSKLGAFGADLGAVACFFIEPWRKVSPALSEADQVWLLNQAAFRLRALGRLAEALEPMRAVLTRVIDAKEWGRAAISVGNLSELEMSLGRVADAMKDGERSVEFADRSSDEFQRRSKRTTLADSLHQQGKREEALELFRKAESMQAKNQPEYPLLYSLGAFRYCDLLLSRAERAAWQQRDNIPAWDVISAVDACRAVEQRAEQTIEWEGGRLLDIALDHLILGRAALLRSVLENFASQAPQYALSHAKEELDAAVDGLRAAGTTHHIPRGLLARAWLHALAGDSAAALADLDEAWQIASRGGMRLHMADARLHRARLFRDKAELKKARELIEQCGYWRRKEELEDAETAAKNWP